MAKKVQPRVEQLSAPSQPSRPPLKGVKGPPALDFDFGGEEHRRFPRAKLNVRFDLWIGDGAAQRFAATLYSANLSVSGAFLESSFFLPLETELRMKFVLEEGEDPVQARAVIVREERERQGKGRTGMAVRFLEFYGQSEVSLAKLFLGLQLREFAEDYLQSKRARSIGNEFERVVDALAAWELKRATAPGNTWGLRQEEA